MSVYARLRGGPSDGLCAVATVARPAIIHEMPRRPDVHEVPIVELVWDEVHRWYEPREVTGERTEELP